jgi:hypothetical protein
MIGMVMPTDSDLSVSNHIDLVLFSGDSFMDVMTVLFIGVPVVAVILAAATRSRAAHGLAAGSMAFWIIFTVSQAVGSGSSLDVTARYSASSFWPILLGALGVAIAGCLAMVLPTPAAAVRPVPPLLPIAGLALLPLAGLIGAVEYVDSRDQSSVGTDVFGDATYGDDTTYGDDGDDGEAPSSESDTGGTGGAGASGSYDVVCTDDVDSDISSTWQDTEGAIHVIVLVDNGCEAGQALDDADATFTLTSGGATVAEASFDFAGEPVVVPGHGTAETEIVFGPASFVDLGAVETLGLSGSGSTGGGTSTGSLGLGYSYTCTDAPDATSASSGGPVTGAPTQAPIPAETNSPTDALSRLSEIAEADEPYIEADVLDRWVPQISSKKPDTTLPDGSVWDAASILSDHRSWRERFPRVHLLWSGDYSTFELTDYWVTVVAVPFATAEGALGWCDDHALPDDDCYAKLISHTHPHEGSTRLR